jgi:Xaa-Pro aminopeptidase
MKQDIASRLASLRAQMTANNIAATVIPQTDPHQSEYIADHWQLRRYFSGFTGSAGQLVVTADKALLWTDSRYFIQSSQQLAGTEIVLMKDGLSETPSIAEWLGNNLNNGDTVGIDGMVFSATETENLRNAMARHGKKVVTTFDPACAWPDRPALPECKVFVHDIKYAGESAASKIARLLAAADKAEMAKSVFISALDEIAWTLNIRSNDVTYNPVATAFLYLSANGSTLLIDPAKLTDEVKAYLAEQGVATANYADVKEFIADLPEDDTVLVEPARNAVAVVEALGKRAVRGASVAAVPKGCKNDVQIAGIHAAMARDGVALVKSFIEIEKRAAGQGEPLTELGVCEVLRRYRSQQPLYFEESFGTIAGYAGHGAIVHYEPTEESDVPVVNGNLLLVDSGAQYLDGTTDITRTVSLGTPNAQQKRDFTLVMKGHIALGTMIFPAETRGAQLDAVARMFLWREGLTYLHGTGHGVGHFLNVHEGPQSVRLNNTPTPLMLGMITSNEPGLYREDVHGIRCENLVLTVPAMTTEFGEFQKFETLTLFPFDLQLFETSIMTDEEIEWVNAYHNKVRTILTPMLDTEEERNWLAEKTQPLTH